jgi:asparagine synthase (glutamine-hydrolysing)
MCGISGYISKIDRYSELLQSLSVIKHRGPDAQGSYYLNQYGMNIGLGHVRLSIIDLSHSADQPMISKCGQYILIFNGEIYNFIELKKNLISKGVCFNTTSDSEVLLQHYIFYGIDGIKDFDGMFAFSILDKTKNILFLVRDQLGIKPLYYYWQEETRELFFSSEIKGLRPFQSVQFDICKQDVYEFFNCGWVFEPNTGYNKIKKVPLGSYIEINLNALSFDEFKYFDLFNESRPPERALDKLLIKNINSQLISDVPLGLFFSGGTDSSLLAAYSTKRLNAISVRYPSNELNNSSIFDDFPYINQIANELRLKLDLKEFEVGSKDPVIILKSFKEVVVGNEELISDFTYVPSKQISKVARDLGYTVMLSGMGGDELFGGYPRYLLCRYYRLFSFVNFFSKPFISLLRKNRRFSKKIQRFRDFFLEKNMGNKYSKLLGYFSSEEVKSLFPDENFSRSFNEKLQLLLEPVIDLSMLKQAMYLDIFGFLPHNLIVADKSSMAASLEMRVPLLSKDLLISSFNTEDKVLISNGKLKCYLKKMLIHKLPINLVNRPKTGFNPPLDEKIANLGKDVITKILNESTIFDYLSDREAYKIINQHFEGRQNNTFKIWQLIYFSLWLNENITSNKFTSCRNK